MTAAPQREPVRSPNGKIKGYSIGGTYYSNRQYQQQFGSLKGTGHTIESRQQINKETGRPGKRLRATTPPRAKPEPQPREKGKFAPRITTVKTKFQSAQFDARRSGLDYAETRARIYIGKIPNAGPGPLLVWVTAYGTVDKRSKSKPKTKKGWLTIAGLNAPEIVLERDWDFSSFVEVERIRILWEQR